MLHSPVHNRIAAFEPELPKHTFRATFVLCVIVELEVYELLNFGVPMITFHLGRVPLHPLL